MSHRPYRGSAISRAFALIVGLLSVVAACSLLPSGVVTPTSEASPRPEPSPTAITKTLCESGADLRADIDFLRSLGLSEDGLVAVLVAIDSALREAQTLRQLIGEEYRPLTADLVASLQELRVTVDELGEQETVGASIATIGESITEIGDSMDALTLRLRDPCPGGDS